MRVSGRSARTVMPGKKDYIKVSVPTRNRRGALSRTIRVTTNDPRQRQISLRCTGTVKRPFGGKQPSANFGVVKRTMPSMTKTIKLTPGDGGPIKPEIGEIKRSGITAELRTITEGSEYELDVTLSPPWPNTRINTFFPIRTGVPQAPEDHVRISANVEPRLRTTPSRFTVPLSSHSKSETVSVVWAEGVESRITDATPTDRRLSALIKEIGGRQAVVLKVPADFAPGRRQVAVTLRTDDDEIRAFSVPIRFEKARRSGKYKSTARRNIPPKKTEKCETPVKPTPGVVGTQLP